jgi:hypothetical protein
MLGRRAVLAALAWLGFVDLSAPPPVPVEAWLDDLEPDPRTNPAEVHISLGVFVLTGSASRA